MKGQLFLKTNVEGRTKKSLGECLEIHEQVAGTIYDAAIADEQLPKEISFKTYKDIGVKLIESAFELNASAAAVRAISVGMFELQLNWIFSGLNFFGLDMGMDIFANSILCRC